MSEDLREGKNTYDESSDFVYLHHTQPTSKLHSKYYEYAILRKVSIKKQQLFLGLLILQNYEGNYKVIICACSHASGNLYIPLQGTRKDGLSKTIA